MVAGRYRLERLIAVGGMAKVHRAVDAVLDRPVAVKALPFGPKRPSCGIPGNLARESGFARIGAHGRFGR